MDFLETHPEYSSSAHQTQWVNEKDGSFGQVYGQHARLDLELVDTFGEGAPWHTCSFLFRQALLELPEWFDHIISGDRAIFMIIASKGPIRVFPIIMSVYRRHADGMSTCEAVRNEKFYLERITLLNFFDQYLQGRCHKEIEQARAYHRREAVSQLVKQGDYRAASRQASILLSSSFKLRPDTGRLILIILRGCFPRLWQAALNFKVNIGLGSTLPRR